MLGKSMRPDGTTSMEMPIVALCSAGASRSLPADIGSLRSFADDLLVVGWQSCAMNK
jgi:hypothetical protein